MPTDSDLCSLENLPAFLTVEQLAVVLRHITLYAATALRISVLGGKSEYPNRLLRICNYLQLIKCCAGHII